MKTVKNVLLLVALLVLVVACQDPIDNLVKSQVQTQVQKTNFHLEAEVTASTFNSQNYLELGVAKAANCNLGESVIVSIFGVKSNQDLNGAFELPYGQIDFINPASGCYLTGKISGNSNNDSGKLIIDATVKIDYGVGIFKADGGVLNLAIIGTTEADQQMNYIIEIDGYLENRML